MHLPLHIHTCQLTLTDLREIKCKHFEISPSRLRCGISTYILQLNELRQGFGLVTEERD